MAGQYSGDGRYWWNGQRWVPVDQRPYQQQPLNYQAPQMPQPPPRKGMSTWAIVGIVVGSIAVAALIIGVLGAIGSSTNTNAGGSSAKANPSQSPTNPSQSQSNGISKGLGSQDASGDISIGKIKTDFGFTTVQIIAKNNSEKRSNYMVSVSAESADGKTQYDSSPAFINNVEPGQTATGDALFTKEFPSGAKVVVKEVSRTSAVG